VKKTDRNVREGVEMPGRKQDRTTIPDGSGITRRETLHWGAALPLMPGAMTMTEQTPETHAHPARPNILVLMTDDHGQWASHCYGNRELSTPNMDYLAETGARMQNAYTPCPVCSPARASFWTGRLPSQHGIHDWIQEDGDTRPWFARERPLASVLQSAGYHTGLAGKWHCGQGEIPDAGFDFALSHTTNQYPHRGVQHFTENGKPVAFTGQQSAADSARRKDSAHYGAVDPETGFRFRDLICLDSPCAAQRA
jgi:arylsulfatase A-like enzyme